MRSSHLELNSYSEQFRQLIRKAGAGRKRPPWIRACYCQAPSCPIPEIKGRCRGVPTALGLQRGRRAALEVIVFAVPKSLYFAGAAARRMQTINSADIRPAVLASLRRRQLFCLTSLMTSSSPTATCPLQLQPKCDFRADAVNLFGPLARGRNFLCDGAPLLKVAATVTSNLGLPV